MGEVNSKQPQAVLATIFLQKTNAILMVDRALLWIILNVLIKLIRGTAATRDKK